MKRYFVQIFRFFFIAIGLYIIGILIWGSMPYTYIGSNFLYRQGSYGHLNRRIKEIPKYGEVDILFVGSSRVYRGFDPLIFKSKGIKIFVLGSSNQTPLQSYILLKRYLRYLKPKLVVYDLLPSTFAIKGVESTLDLLANDIIDHYSFQIAREQNDLIVWNTLIYAYLMDVIGKHDDFTEPIHKQKDFDTYISGGYVKKASSFQKKIELCEKKSTIKWEQPIDIQLKYFNKMILFFEENNQKFMFVNMPLAHFQCYKNNDVLEKYIPKSVTYLDFNRLLDFNDSIDFYDEYHLNTKGVLKLNSFMIKNNSFNTF